MKTLRKLFIFIALISLALVALTPLAIWVGLNVKNIEPGPVHDPTRERAVAACERAALEEVLFPETATFDNVRTQVKDAGAEPLVVVFADLTAQNAAGVPQTLSVFCSITIQPDTNLIHAAQVWLP